MVFHVFYKYTGVCHENIFSFYYFGGFYFSRRLFFEICFSKRQDIYGRIASRLAFINL